MPIHRYKASSALLLIFGILITTFSLFLFLAGCFLYESKEELAVLVFFAVTALLGIFMLCVGVRQNRLVTRFYLYTPHLAADPQKSIDTLAKKAGLSSAQVLKDLQQMIRMRFFINVQIDYEKRRLIYLNQSLPRVAHVKKLVPKQVAACPACGAPNVVRPGEPARCEYCDAPLTK